jgi:HK97 family phage portal protein
MGLFSGPVRERRYNGFTAQFSNPPILPNSASSIATMNLARAESSLQKVVVWSSVALIAGLASELPFDVFANRDDDTHPVATPSYLLDVGGDGYGTADWIYSLLVSFLLRGNGFGRVTARDTRYGYPTTVSLFHPDEVGGWRDNTTGLPVWTAGGYEVPREDMWHRRAFTVPGALCGLSPVSYHAQTIGLGLSAQRFGVQFFSDGASPTGLLTNDEEDLTDGIKARTAKERFVAALNGGREPVVLGKGWKWQQISIAPEESQFLETQKYTEAECARLYGPGMAEVLGYDSGASMTYANVEQRNIHLLTYCLDPWFSRIERALSDMLPRPRFVKLNRNALLRTDLLTRYKAHGVAIAAKFMAPSEARAIEDMPPLTDAQQAELVDIPAPSLSPLKFSPNK